MNRTSEPAQPGRRRLLAAGTLAGAAGVTGALELAAAAGLAPLSAHSGPVGAQADAARPSAGFGAATNGKRFVEVAAADREPPPLALDDLGGRRHDLADYRGRVVVLNFWATWCAPCLEEMPSLQLLQARLAKAAFSVLLVNYGESIERVNKYVDDMALDLPVLLDAFHRVRHDWKVRALPTSFLIDAEGLLRYVVRGELDWIGEEAIERVRTLLPASQRSATRG